MPCKKIEVFSYSGYMGEESPRAFLLDGVRVEVSDILERWKEQRIGETGVKRCFKVKGGDGRSYALCYDEKEEEWTCSLDGNDA